MTETWLYDQGDEAYITEMTPGAGIMESDGLSAVRLFSVRRSRHWTDCSACDGQALDGTVKHCTVGSRAVTARPVPCAWTRVPPSVDLLGTPQRVIDLFLAF